MTMQMSWSVSVENLCNLSNINSLARLKMYSLRYFIEESCLSVLIELFVPDL